MKTEFLQNLKVGDQPLSKEVIDAIMAENGRDIEAAKKPFEDYGTVKQQLSEAQKALKDIQDKGTDLETAQQKAQEWENKYNQAIQDHQKELADRDFKALLEGTITSVKGKNAKAITALLDVDTLRESKNQEADIKAALEALKKDNGYLFDEEGTPPPYAPRTGTNTNQPTAPQETLAGALRARYEKG
ncbi:MAG: hypothetical protein E7433_00885 [Ruminococcaceae bacterium]|nr:hypothetical protein [Oscillospiraceae bacterium]